MSNNTVDVSPERIAAEFANIRAEAIQIHPLSDTSPDHVTGNVNDNVKRESDVTIGASGFEIPDMPTGNLCCFAGCVAANALAPNWVESGLTEQHIESVGRPLGAVIDKYLDKYFPGQKLGELVEPWKEELALGYAAFQIYTTFAHIPRKVENELPPAGDEKE